MDNPKSKENLFHMEIKRQTNLMMIQIGEKSIKVIPLAGMN